MNRVTSLLVEIYRSLSLPRFAGIVACLCLGLVLCGERVVALTPQPASTTSQYQLYLPLVTDRLPHQTFGIQIDPLQAYWGFPYVEDLHASVIRYNSLNWSLAEPNPDQRLWEQLATLEDALLRASQADVQTLLVVHVTPLWARSIETASCSRILSDSLAAFGDFIYDAVRRYSYPPYNVLYWEIWNEPDIGYSLDLADMPFGCWADYSDEVWGGEYYAQVLRAVYPRLKEANPLAQLVIGGLHLDCDPRPESNYCAAVEHDPRQPLYLSGILRAGGGKYFDGVGFHAYDYYHYWEPELGRYSNNNWGSGWNSSGPVIIAKAGYIRQVLDEFGVSGKFLINTEGSLICGPPDDTLLVEGCESDDDSLYEQTKARYIPQLYASAIASGLRANIWYYLFGYRHAELVSPYDFSLRPAYDAYQFAHQTLAAAQYLGELDLQSGVRSYEFQVGGSRLWLIWSLDGESHIIDLAEMPKSMYDHMGSALTPVDPLTVTLDPLYLLWAP